MKFLPRTLPPSLGIGSYVFAAVFLIRLLPLVWFTASPSLLPEGGDMHFYDEWAQRILRGEFTDGQAFYGLPLYPFFLAAVFKIAGYNPFIPGFLQVCAEALTGVLIYKISVVTFRQRALRPAKPSSRFGINPLRAPEEIIGLMSAAGWALFVPAQAYAIILMPTAWLTASLWFVVWQVVKRERAPGPGISFWLGLLVGVVAMAVASILFILPLVLVAILFRNRALQETSLRAMAAVLLLIGTIAGSSPCWLHNTFVARDPVFLSAHSGVNFWIGNNREATGYPHFPAGLRAGQADMLKDSIAVAEAARGKTLPRSEVAAYWSEKAWAEIKDQPLAWIKLLATKVANFWNAFAYDDLSIVDALRSEGILLPGLRFGLVAAFGLAGAIFAWFLFPGSRWVAAAILLHLAAVLPVFVTERYRLAATPGLLIFASFGLVRLWQQAARLQIRAALPFLLTVIGTSAFVSVPRSDPALWALKSFDSGRRALAVGDLDRAEQDLQRASSYVHDNPETNLALGNVRLARKEHESASAYYKATLALDPTHKRALHNLGFIALEDGRPAEAEAYLRRALDQEPISATTRYLLAKALLDQNNVDVAQTELDLALRLRPTQQEFIALRELIDQRRAARDNP